MKAKLRSRNLGERSVLTEIQPGASFSSYSTQGEDYFPALFHKNLIKERSRLIPKNWITQEAVIKIALGQIPDLRSVCLSLYHMFGNADQKKSVIQAIPILHDLISWPSANWDTLRPSSKNSHLLINNKIMKAILIFWPKSGLGNIHGHPKGGGVFQLLKGSIEEWRYTTDESPKLLSVSTYQKGSVGFINDEMGYHAVGNPFDSPAVTLHVYKHK